MVFPLFLFGSYMGVILYVLLSEVWLTVILVGTLGFLSIQMIFKAREKYMQETVKMA
jgi:uncharacterized membrane protein YfcA